MMETPQEIDINIRTMTEQDLPQVHAIDLLSFSMPWPETSYHFELRENPASMLWVAEAHLGPGEYRVVGLAVVWLILDEAHIASIAVHPDFRGHGIGRKLLAAALYECILKQANTATLEVRAGNLVAQNLYRDFGFEVVSFRPRYYVDNNEDAYLMTVTDLDEGYLRWLEKITNTNHRAR